MTDFPIYIDNSMLSAFKACPRKFQLSYIQHYKPVDESIHLLAGGAIAHGLERWRKSVSEGHDATPGGLAERQGLIAMWTYLHEMDPFGRLEESPKHSMALAAALCLYFHDFPIMTDGEMVGVEFSFAHPFGPFLYVGRLDLVQRAQGMTFGVDEKTTSMFGPTWAKQWDLRAQFTGYTWAMAEQGLKLDGFKVRGIKIGKYECETLQTIVYKTAYEIEEWKQTTDYFIGQIVECEKAGYYPQNLDHSCSSYSGCEFCEVCRTTGETRQRILDTRFTRRKWDPVARTANTLVNDA